jgi:hypothetical protein
MVILTNNIVEIPSSNNLYNRIVVLVCDSSSGVLVFEKDIYHEISITVNAISAVVTIQNSSPITLSEGTTYTLSYPELNTQKLTINPIDAQSTILVTYKTKLI